jgi:CheY-like chemotaxis protein
MAQSGNIPGEDPTAVLCVGADKTLNYTRQLILERHGYTAVVACNLLEATNAFEQHPIGCVLIEAEFESILPALQSMAPHIAVIVVGLSASDHHGTP